MTDKRRRPIGDGIRGMLMEEIVYVCPLGLSYWCERLEKVETPFTIHHIDGDSSNSEYWNLIRICGTCHEAENGRHQDGDLQRTIRLRKRNLAMQYFGPLSVNVLQLAHMYGVTSAMPAMAMKLLERGYVEITNDNTITVGAAKHVTFQDYRLTPAGRELVEKLFRPPDLPTSTFAL
jgi:hypothetical protein